MSADPNPQKVLAVFDRQSAIVKAHAGRPKRTDLFEVQRWMAWNAPKRLIAPISNLLHFVRQRPVARPEARCCAMPHRSVQRPARRSDKASATSQLRRPAATSASSCRSHSSASNSANHARKAARCSGDNCRTAASSSSTVLIAPSYLVRPVATIFVRLATKLIPSSATRPASNPPFHRKLTAVRFSSAVETAYRPRRLPLGLGGSAGPGFRSKSMLLGPALTVAFSCSAPDRYT